MAIMYKRSLIPPNYSFFLFGPRSTGKTTWLRKSFPEAKWFNLLNNEELYRLIADSRIFRQQVMSLSEGSWIIIDEVQKAPALLNQVHDIISLNPSKYLFALSGSSARKLKRQGINLLAGRVINKKFFPLTAFEMEEKFTIEKALLIGMLPGVRQSEDYSEEILSAYVYTYLNEEIKQEALVEDLGSFTRFLPIAGIINSTIPNITNIARDCGVARKTVERYFDILVDTLIGYFLPAWQPRLKVRETSHPKFYLFDCGVCRALTNRLGVKISDEEKGNLFETYILHELRSYQNLLKIPGELSYWRTGAGVEIDFIWSIGDEHIGIEVKSSVNWRPAFSKALKELLQLNVLKKAYGIYLGTEVLQDDGVVVYPVAEFLKRLYQGDIF